jgi:hypothetical protein
MYLRIEPSLAGFLPVQSCTGCDFLAVDFTRDSLAVKDWLQSMMVGETKMADSLAIFTLWCIWNQRNAAVFISSRCTPMKVFAMIRDECSWWASAGGRVLSPLAVAII